MAIEFGQNIETTCGDCHANRGIDGSIECDYCPIGHKLMDESFHSESPVFIGTGEDATNYLEKFSK